MDRMPETPTRQTLPKEARIRKRADFDRIFRRGLSCSDRWLTLYADGHPGPQARLGIAAGRRLGNAPRRNRCKRLVREAFRRIRAELPPGTDWVVVPRNHGPRPPSFNDYFESLGRLTRQLIRRLRSAPPAKR